MSAHELTVTWPEYMAYKRTVEERAEAKRKAAEEKAKQRKGRR